MGFSLGKTLKSVAPMVAPLSALGLTSMLTGGGGSDGSGYLQSGANAIGAVKVPTPEEMKVQIQQLVQQGRLTPEQAATIMADPSAFGAIKEDDTSLNAQYDALEQLKQYGADGGLSPQDKARIAQVNDEFANTERGSREAVNQNMAERGVYGSGAEMAAKLAGVQTASNNAARSAADISSSAADRALSAIKSSGDLGGQINQQEYQKQAQKAAAVDAINKFNAQNSQSVNMANVGARNDAQKYNLDTAQAISNTNTANTNANRIRNADLVQQNYDNQLKKASAMAGQYASLADDEAKKKAAKDAMTGQLIGTAGTIGAMALMSDKRQKKNVTSETDLDAFMSKMKPKSFDYKDPSGPGRAAGRRVGVMAQDVEKSKAGRSMVKNTKDGKMLDSNQAIGVILASLAHLHHQVNSKGGKK